MKALLWRRVAIVVASTATCTAYDVRDPSADHTSEAIRLDGMGMLEASRLSFEAAAQFTPSTSSFVNLGVCYMRTASRSANREVKVSNYKKAKHAMERGLSFAASQNDRRLYEENWGALMTNFEIESVVSDEPVVDNRQCGPPADPLEEATVTSTRFHRDFLEHQRDVAIAEPLPRVSVRDIDLNESVRQYAERREAFVLTGATETWKVFGVRNGREWLRTLAKRWPSAVVDFYPYNMLSKTRQSPFLTRLPRAVRELDTLNTPNTESVFGYDAHALRGRYLHLQLTPNMWSSLENTYEEISPNRHWHLENDGWMDECLTDPAVREEYHLKTHWKIVLAGARGAGMFNHSDSLQTSSWHAHLFGKKWWHVCSPTSGRCFEGVLEPGDILYYGKGWSHETQNLVTPTVTITDTALHDKNFEAVADKLHAECTRDLLNFKFSPQLCDALDSCYHTMRRLFDTGETKSPQARPPWRTVASEAVIKKRESTKVSDNNYDGRNYITE